MIIGKMLNSGATVNNFIEIGALEFIPGEELTVKVRIYDDQLNIRYIPVATNVTTFTLNNTSSTFTTVGTHETDDRSIISFSLTEAQTSTLLGGNITFELDLLGDGTSIRKGIIYNAFSKVITC